MDVMEGNGVEEHDVSQRYRALQELGSCYASVGNYALARRCYEETATLAPDEPGPYIGLGVVALQSEQLEDAETAFKVACRLDNNCSGAYNGLAMVYQQKAEFARSLQMYSRCLELESDNLIALLGLFQTSRHTGSFSKVRVHLEVYLQMHPGDTAIMFCLVSLYIKAGRFNEAKRVLSDILILDPAYSIASDLLEEVEHKLAQKSGAKTTMV